MKKMLQAFLMAAMLLLCLVPVTAMADSTVTTEADLIAAVGEGGTVTLGANITLSSKITVSNTVVIDGQGQYTITRGVASGTDVFEVAAAGDLTMKDLTLDGNHLAAGASALIFNNSGTLTLENCTLKNAVRSNAGGAVRSATGGTVTVTGGAFEDNTATGGGGAIASWGILNITGTAFSGNQSAGSSNGGGALYLSTACKAAITGASFIGNSSEAAGGAIYAATATTQVSLVNCVFGGTESGEGNSAATAGGAIYVTKGKVDSLHTSFLCNTTTGDGGGAVYVADNGQFTGLDSTFTGNQAGTNGGAIALYTKTVGSYQKATLVDCDITGNYAATRAGAVWIHTRSTLYITGGTCENNTSKSNSADIRVNSSDEGALYWTEDIQATATHNTASGVTAIYDWTDTAVVDNAGASTGYETLSGAVAAAATGSYVRMLTDQTADAAMAVSGKTITVSGGGHTLTRGAGNTSQAVFTVSANAGLTLSDITVDGNNIEVTQTLVTNNGSFTLGSGATLKNANRTSGGGAAIYNNADGAVLTVCDGAQIINNAAAGNGGAIYTNKSSTITIGAATIRGNHAGQYGGAVFINNASAAAGFTGTVFEDNYTSATGSASGGGAVDLHNSAAVTMTDCTFDGNYAAQASETGSPNGGAVRVNGAMDVTFDGCTFTGNSTATYGGAVYNHAGGTVTFSGCTVTDNSATGSGGALYNNNASGTVAISGGTYSGNRSTGSAGGVIYNKGTLIVSDGTFQNNEAHNYGGVLHNNGGTATLAGSYSGNTAGTAGGVAYNATGSTLTVTGGTYSGNQATTASGGVVLNQGTLTVSGGTFTNNTAVTAGGAINVAGGSATISGGTFTGNTAANAVSAASGDTVHISGGASATISGGSISGSETRDVAVTGTLVLPGVSYEAMGNVLHNVGGQIVYGDTGRFTGHSTTLDAGFALNFYSGAGTTVTFNWGTGELEKNETIHLTAGVAKCPVAAKDWTAAVTATLKDAEDNVLAVYKTSLEAYLAELTAEDAAYSDDVKAVGSALQTYCTAATAYFGNAEPIEDDSLTGFDTAVSTLFALKEGGAKEDSGVKFMGKSLLAKDVTLLRIYFQADAQPTVTGYTVAQSEDGYWYVDIPVTPGNLVDHAFDVQVEGTAVGFSIGVNDYIEQALRVYAGSEIREKVNLVNLCKALYLYGQAANAYIAANAE